MRYRIVTNALQRMGLGNAEINMVVRAIKLLQKPAFREAANRVIVMLGGTPPTETTQYVIDVHIRDSILIFAFTGFGMPKVLYGSFERLPTDDVGTLYREPYDTIVLGEPYSLRVRGGQDLLDQDAIIEAFRQTEGLGVCSLRGNVATAVVAHGYDPAGRAAAIEQVFTEYCLKHGMPLTIRVYDPH